MRNDPQKLVAYAPSEKGWIRRLQTLIDETTTGSVVIRILVGCVDQNVGIYDHGFSSSNSLYNSSRFAMSTRGLPIGQDGSSKGFCLGSLGSFRAEIMCRIPASTMAVMVVPRRAASMRSCRMRVSSMFRVVFIWLTISSIWVYGRPTPSVARLQQ